MIINSYSFGSGAPTDPFFSSVVAVMPPSVADALTTFVDVKGNTYTVSAGSGVVETEVGIAGMGGTCCYTAIGATKAFQVPTSSSWSILSAGDFTVEALIRLLDAPGGGAGAAILSRGTASTDNWVFRCVTGQLQWVYPGLSGANYAQTWATGTTYHVAVSRVGTNHYLSIDGVVSLIAVTNRTVDGTGQLNVGVGASSTGVEYIAHRITKGVGRYTANFTPPTSFPQS